MQDVLVGLPVKDSFYGADHDKDGLISFPEFKTAVQSLHLESMDDDVLAHYFEENRASHLTLEQFRETIKDMLESTSAQGDPPAVILGQLKLCFDMFDFDGDGVLKFSEFRHMWNQLNLPNLPRETSKMVYSNMVKNDDLNEIQYGDIRSLVLNHDDALEILTDRVEEIAKFHAKNQLARPAEEAVKLALRSLLVGAMHSLLSSEAYITMSELFTFFDKNRDGFIDMEDIEEVWNDIYIAKLTPQDTVAIFEYIDKGHDEVIEFRKFKQALGQISSILDLVHAPRSENIEPLVGKVLKELATHLNLKVDTTPISSKKDGSSQTDRSGQKDADSPDDDLFPHVDNLHTQMGAASTVTTTTNQDHLRRSQSGSAPAKSRSPKEKSRSPQKRQPMPQKRQPATVPQPIVMAKEDEESGSSDSQEQLESPFNLKAAYHQKRLKARHRRPRVNQTSLGTLPYSSNSSIPRRSLRNRNISMGSRRRLTDESHSHPIFLAKNSVSKEFHDAIRSPPYLYMIYHGLNDYVEGSPELNGEDLLSEMKFSYITEEFLEEASSHKLFKLVDEEKKGRITIWDTLFWIEDQLDAIETESHTDFDPNKYIVEQVDVTKLPAVPERRVMQNGEEVDEEDEQSSLPEEEEPPEDPGPPSHRTATRSNLLVPPKSQSHSKSKSKHSVRGSDPKTEESSTSSTKRVRRNPRKGGSKANSKATSTRSRPSVSHKESAVPNDDVFENPYSVEDKIASSRVSTPLSRPKPPEEDEQLRMKLSDVMNPLMAATEKRASRDNEVLRGQSPGYKHPKRKANHARGSIVRKQDVIPDEESAYSELEDERNSLSGMFVKTGICPNCHTANDVAVSPRSRFDTTYVIVQCCECNYNFHLSLPEDLVDPALVRLRHGQADREPPIESVSEGSTQEGFEDLWKRYMDSKRVSMENRFTDSSKSKKSSSGSKRPVVRGRRDASFGIDPEELEDLIVIQGQKYTSSEDPTQRTQSRSQKQHVLRIPTKETQETDNKSYSRKRETTSENDNGFVLRLATNETQDTGISRSREEAEPGANGRKVRRRPKGKIDIHERNMIVKRVLDTPPKRVRQRPKRKVTTRHARTRLLPVHEDDEVSEIEVQVPARNKRDEVKANPSPDTLGIVASALWRLGQGADGKPAKRQPREQRQDNIIQIRQPVRKVEEPHVFPSNVMHWSVNDVGHWFARDPKLGLYENEFRAQDVDGPTLLNLQRTQLVDFGVPGHHQHDMWRAIEHLRRRNRQFDRAEPEGDSEPEDSEPMEIDEKIMQLLEQQTRPVPVVLGVLFWIAKWILTLISSLLFGTAATACICTYLYFGDVGVGLGPHRPTSNLRDFYERPDESYKTRLKRFRKTWPCTTTLRDSPFRYMFLYFDGLHEGWQFNLNVVVWFTSTAFVSLFAGPFVLGWMMEHQWYLSVQHYSRIDGRITYGAVNEYVRRCVNSPLGYIVAESFFLGILLFDLMTDLFLAIEALSQDQYLIFTLMMIFIIIPFILLYIKTFRLHLRLGRRCFGWPVFALFAIFFVDWYCVQLLLTCLVVTALTGQLTKPSWDMIALQRVRVSAILFETIPNLFIGIMCLIFLNQMNLNAANVYLCVLASCIHLFVILVVYWTEASFNAQSLPEYYFMTLDGRLGVLPHSDDIEQGRIDRIDYSDTIFVNSSSVHEFLRVSQSPEAKLGTVVISRRTLKALPERTRHEFADNCQKFRIALHTNEDWRLWFKDEDLQDVSHLLIDKLGRSALHYRAGKGDNDKVRYLLQQGVDPNLADKKGDTPLLFAVTKNHVETVKILLEAGVDPNAYLSRANQTSLMYAVAQGNQDMIRALLAAGARVDIRDAKGYTAMDIAMKNNYQDIFFKLLSVVDGEVDPLFTRVKLDEWFDSARGGDQVSLDSLLSRGMHPDVTDEVGNTALIVASRMGQSMIVDKLLEHGAKANILNQYGTSALLWASRNGHFDIAQKLFQAGAKIGVQNQYGNTALMWACKNGHRNIVQMLCHFGTGINTSNNVGQTPLLIAVQSGYLDTVVDLIQFGANIDAIDNHGNTALMWAIDLSAEPFVRELLKYRANPEMTNDQGKKALDLAITANNQSIVWLLERELSVHSAHDIFDPTGQR